MSEHRMPRRPTDTGATYGGCKVCGQPFRVGEWMAPTLTGAVHVDCAAQYITRTWASTDGKDPLR